jgi:hypothetical protein
MTVEISTCFVPSSHHHECSHSGSSTGASVNECSVVLCLVFVGMPFNPASMMKQTMTAKAGAAATRPPTQEAPPAEPVKNNAEASEWSTVSSVVQIFTRFETIKQTSELSYSRSRLLN